MSEAIKEIVKKTYTNAVTKDAGCGCGPSCCSPTQDVEFSENYSNLEGYEPNADFGLGCGIPTEFAKIKEGDTVLDLGSGAGNDVFVARSIVGESGHVIGVDMTEAMIEKANENNRKLGFKNIEIVKEREIDFPDELVLQFISKEELAIYREKKSTILSITVYADK